MNYAFQTYGAQTKQETRNKKGRNPLPLTPEQEGEKKDYRKIYETRENEISEVI